MRSPVTTALLVCCLLALGGCSLLPTRTVVQTRVERVTVPQSLTAPIPEPPCDGCRTYGDAVRYVPPLREALEACNARLREVRSWSESDR